MNKKLILFFSGLALFTAVLVLSADFFLGRIPAPPPASPELQRDEPPQPLPALPEKGAMPNEDDGTAFHIQEGIVDHRPVRYTVTGFSPRRIIIQETDDLGCLITVVNQSDAPLRVGVNPHDPAGDPGANYGEITPGKASILDVRYSSLQEITLHSHSDPMHEFM